MGLQPPTTLHTLTLLLVDYVDYLASRLPHVWMGCATISLKSPHLVLHKTMSLYRCCLPISLVVVHLHCLWYSAYYWLTMDLITTVSFCNIVMCEYAYNVLLIRM